MAWLLILGLAVSSSIDNLGVGLSYGIRGIRIRFLSNMVISFICFLFSSAGILFERWISEILPGILPVLLGVFLLAVIGIRIILLAVPRKPKAHKNYDQNDSRQIETSIRGLKEIFSKSEKADLGRSGDIGLWESILLGITLSANALTNGLGAGLLGLPLWAISISAAIGSFVTVWSGVYLGRKIAGIRIGPFTIGQFGAIISGILLLVIVSMAFR